MEDGAGMEDEQMRRRTLALSLAALLIALALSACGGGGGNTAAVSGGATMDFYEGPSADADGYGGGDYQEYGYGFESAAPSEPAELPDEAEQQEESRLDNAKIIYTANVEAETTAFEDCAAGLESLVEQMGGYMEYASAEAYGTGYRSGRYTIRVPSRSFEPFMKSIGQIGHIVYQDKSGENISEQYYDTESRLATQETKLERLQALLARAESMEDIITIESAIADTELSIEQLTGTLRHYDALVDYATIYVNLQEVARLSNVETAPPSFTSRLGSAFSDSITGFSDFLQNAAIFVAYSWIWLLLLALILVSVIRIVRRSQREQESFRHPKAPDAKKPDDKGPKN